MTPEEKSIFLCNAEPYQIVEEYPREYTLQMRVVGSRWYLSASRMTKLEIMAYDMACELKALNEAIRP